MPVCGNYLFFELPKKIVLNPKDGVHRRRSCGSCPVHHIAALLLIGHSGCVLPLTVSRFSLQISQNKYMKKT